MKKVLWEGGIVVFLLGLVLVQLFPGVLFAMWPCEVGGPTLHCNRIATSYCRGICGGTNKCQSVIWQYNFCDHGLCYEEYEITCKDGRQYTYDCWNSDPGYWCPVK
jgi:hypothetical protein